MRWSVEADTAGGVVDWPEEVDDLQAALRADLRAWDPACAADARTGSVSARFQVTADRDEIAKAVAREIMIDALTRARLSLSDDPIKHDDVTPYAPD